jgi:hypothetical protein
MKDSSLYQPTLSFGLLLVGPPKTGKTILALSFPNCYIADCDNNLSGPVLWHRRRNPAFSFKYDTINIADDSDQCKQWGLSPGEAVPTGKRWDRLVYCLKQAAKDPSIETIIIDSLAMVDFYLQDYIVENKPAGKEKAMTISDWTPYKNMMTKLVTTFRSVGKMFIMTSHEKGEKDEMLGYVIYKVAMSGQLQDNFGAFFSDVWLTVAEKDAHGAYQYYVKTLPQSRRPGIGNSLNLPENFNFSWDKLQSLLSGSKTPKI